MFRTNCAVGCIAASCIAGTVDAAVFSADMWIYEFNAALVDGLDNQAPVFAYGKAPAGTPVPNGCTAEALDPSSTDITIDCEVSSVALAAADLGIDVLSAVTPVVLSATVGFNGTDFVCLTDIPVPICPGESFYNDLLSLDYGNGSASFKFDSNGSAFGSFAMSIGGGSVSVVLPLQPTGSWDFGYGGAWYTLADSLFLYEGTGTLVQSPAVVPLPASAGMLGLAFAGLAFAGRRRLAS